MLMDIDFSWQSEANCKGIPTQEFYPTRGQVISQELKKRCIECPVKEQCLEHALSYEAYGYWGGTSENQRESIRRSQGIMLRRPESLYFEGTNAERRKSEEARVKIVGRGRKSVAVCGTRPGYNAHLRREEKPCDDCKRAQCDYIMEFKKKKKTEAQV
jgi:WhiB family redox-sensing transcriptional regulator